jgi:DnaJ-class molecular chaperone
MFYFSEGMAIEHLMVQFGLSAPVAFDDVKKVYRSKSKLLHPDLGGPEEEFKALCNAFDELKKLYQAGSRLFDAEPMDEKGSGKLERPAMPRVTVDGIPLCELGLGLGPTINGTDCTGCGRLGYKVIEERGLVTCPSCNGQGVYLHPMYGQRQCSTCDGHGRVNYKYAKVYVLRCSECRGTGEKRIYNPVLPKGRLAFAPQRDAA